MKMFKNKDLTVKMLKDKFFGLDAERDDDVDLLYKMIPKLYKRYGSQFLVLFSKICIDKMINRDTIYYSIKIVGETIKNDDTVLFLALLLNVGDMYIRDASVFGMDRSKNKECVYWLKKAVDKETNTIIKRNMLSTINRLEKINNKE